MVNVQYLFNPVNPVNPVEKAPPQAAKFFNWGEDYSTGAELLDIMIRTGAPGKSAVGIGRE